MEEYKHDTQRFLFFGLNLNSPIDALPDNKLPFCQNIRSYQLGRVEPRPGLTFVASGTNPIHSIRRLNNLDYSDWTHIKGEGTNITYGKNSTTLIEGGMSGHPLSMCPWRPEGATESWMYVADSAKMRKVDRNGNSNQIGLPAPKVPPLAFLGVPYYKFLNDGESYTGWIAEGTATLTPAADSVRTNTDTEVIMYDDALSNRGWCSIVPVNKAMAFHAGQHIIVNFNNPASETVVVQAVHTSVGTTNIKKIIYDNGVSGPCSMTLESGTIHLETDSIIYVGPYVSMIRPFYLRVESVTASPDGSLSIRTNCNIGVGSTGQPTGTWTVTGLPSFRCYLTTTHGSPENIRADCVTGEIATGTGYITCDKASMSPPGDFDMTIIEPGHSISLDDNIHVSLRLDDINRLTSGTIRFDCDSGTVTSPGTEFTKNFYTYDFRPSDLKAIATQAGGGLTTRGTVMGNTIVDVGLEPTARQASIVSRSNTSELNARSNYLTAEVERATGGEATIPEPDSSDVIYTPASIQTGTGMSQWHELVIKFRDLVRIGTDLTRGLADIKKIRISMVAVGGTLTFAVSSWWIGGGYGPDLSPIGAPYLYRYRVRNSLTGVKSNYSPPTRGGVEAWRQRIVVQPPLYTAALEADRIDIERFGGALTNWYYVGSTSNTGSPTFDDDMADDSIVNNISDGNINYQPWLISDIYRFGTCEVVAGTSIKGTGFNPLWTMGTVIEIDGIPHSLYRVISDTVLELADSAGSKENVMWAIHEPKLVGQPLPILFGPLEGFFFGVGDVKNAGTLYFTRGNEPDSTEEINKIEVTSTSEPLQNGCIYNGRAYLFSTERMFQILPAFNTDQKFQVIEIPNSKGLFARWGLAVGPAIWFIGKDGIYETTGSLPISITDQDLFPLFPNEGNPGQSTNGIDPPNFLLEDNLRLSFGDDYLRFDFKDTSSNYRSLIYHLDAKAWWLDKYPYNVLCSYFEEGPNLHSWLIGADNLYQLTGETDNGIQIECKLRTGCRDQGDPRYDKMYGDLMFDLDAAGSSIFTYIWFNNYATLHSTTTLTTTGREQKILPISFGGNDYHERNIGLDLVYNIISGKPLLYIWQVNYIVHPEMDTSMMLEWENISALGSKWVQGMILEADTNGVNKILDIFGDNNVLIATVVANHQDHFRVKPYSWLGTFTNQIRIVPRDTVPWKHHTHEWTFEDAPNYTTPGLFPQWSDGGVKGEKWVIGCKIKSNTEGIDKAIQVQFDGISDTENIVVNSTNDDRWDIFSWNGRFSHQMRLYPLDTVAWKLYDIVWVCEEAPEYTGPGFFEQWDSGGYEGEKWLQGLRLTSDTSDIAKPLQVQIDGATVIKTISVLSSNNNRVTVYSWPGVFTHKMRLYPVDRVEWRYYKHEWIFEPAPELALVWETPDQTNGFDGFHHLKDGYIAHVSTAPITYTVTIDGVEYVYTIPASGGVYNKTYLIFQSVKGKYYRYKLESTQPFRLYKQDCEVRVKPWKSDLQFEIRKPFGDLSLVDGAKI
jgi:hypothetical protein